MAVQEPRGIEQILGAVATNEMVAAALRSYPERDAAIEAIESDMAAQRRRLIEDLRAVLRRRTASACAERIARDAFLSAS